MSLKVEKGSELKVIKTNSGEGQNGRWQYFVSADEHGRNKQTFFLLEPIEDLDKDDVVVVDSIEEMTFKQRQGNDGVWRPDVTVNIKGHISGAVAGFKPEQGNDGELPF